MSWQACEAVRDRSLARGARKSVLFTAACYADESGGNVFPSFDTLMAGAGVARDTVAQALQEAEDRGEIERSGRRRSGTIIYTFAPLVDGHVSSVTEPIGSSATEPRDRSSSLSRRASSAAGLTAVQSDPSSVQQAYPNQKLEVSTEPEDGIESGFQDKTEKKGTTQSAERAGRRCRKEADESARELEKLKVGRASSSKPAITDRAIAVLEDDLAGEVEIDRWASRLVVS